MERAWQRKGSTLRQPRNQGLCLRQEMRVRVDGVSKVPGNMGHWHCGFVEEAGVSVLLHPISEDGCSPKGESSGL